MSDTYVNSSNLSRFWTNAKNYVDAQKDELFVTLTQQYDGTQFVHTSSHTFAELKAALQAGRHIVVLFDGVKDATTTPTHHYRSFLQLETEGDTVLIFYGIDAYNNEAYGIQARFFNSNTYSAQFTTLITPPSPVYTAEDNAKLDALAADTGWVDQTIASSNKLSSGSWVTCRRIGNIVSVRGLIVANSNFADGNDVTVSTLDTDFWPSGIVRFQAGSYGQLWTISINTDGTLVEHNSSGTAPGSGSTKSNRFNVTYFVD